MSPLYRHVLATLFCLVGVHLASAQPDAAVPLPLAMLPAETQAAFYLDLTAFHRAESLVSILTVEEMQKLVHDGQPSTGYGRYREAAGSIEAASRIAFDVEYGDRVTQFAAGVINPAGLRSQDDFAVVRGPFTTTFAQRMLRDFGIYLDSAEHQGVFPSLRSNPVHVSIKHDQMILLSKSSAWLDSVSVESPAQQGGLAPPGSPLHLLLHRKADRSPDLLVYANRDFFEMAVGEDPMIRMMIGPLLQARAAGLFVYGGRRPSIELVLLCADEEAAGIAAQYLGQLLLLVRSQLRGEIRSRYPEADVTGLQGILTLLGHAEIEEESTGPFALMRIDFEAASERLVLEGPVRDYIRGALAGGLRPSR